MDSGNAYQRLTYSGAEKAWKSEGKEKLPMGKEISLQMINLCFQSPAEGSGTQHVVDSKSLVSPQICSFQCSALQVSK
jgi:hypothetical protein